MLLTGYNPRAVIAFLRTLKQYSIDNYVVVARNSNDNIFLTSYSDKVIFTRSDTLLSLELFSRIIQSSGKSRLIIAPVTEFLNRYILHYRTQLEQMGYIIPLADETLYSAISDKQSFSRICRSRGLTVPEELSLPTEFTSAFVAKPIIYQTHNGKIHSPVLIRTSQEFADFMNSYDPHDFYFQEFVSGKSIYLLLYISKNGKLFRLSQTNFIQQDNGKSIIAAKVNDSFHRTEYADAIVRLFLSLGFSGLVMIEIRKSGDRYFIIEANPRFWGPSQLFVDAGYNFFCPMLNEWGFSCPEPEYSALNHDAKYFWEGGLSEDKHNNNRTVFFDGAGSLGYWDASEIYKRDDTFRIWEAENEH